MLAFKSRWKWVESYINGFCIATAYVSVGSSVQISSSNTALHEGHVIVCVNKRILRKQMQQTLFSFVQAHEPKHRIRCGGAMGSSQSKQYSPSIVNQTTTKNKTFLSLAELGFVGLVSFLIDRFSTFAIHITYIHSQLKHRGCG